MIEKMCNYRGCELYALPNNTYCHKHARDVLKIRNRTKNAAQRMTVYKDRRWPKARAIALKRDGYMCVKCGNTDDLVADHIDGLTYTPADFDPDNLQTLCRSHSGEKAGLGLG